MAADAQHPSPALLVTPPGSRSTAGGANAVTEPSYDACPSCQTLVAAIWTRTTDSSPGTQGNICPHCGSCLRRTLGGYWHIDNT